MQLNGRKGLVIGVETAAGGVIASALGQAGADLGLATMRADEGVLAARRIQRQLREAGRRATTYAFDVTLGQNVKVSTRQVTKELGGLDFLVSASELPFSAPLSRLTDSDLAHVMTVNFYSHVFAIRAAADEFRRAGGGQVLLVVHEGARDAETAAYVATQAAALSLVASLSEELRPQRISLNAVVLAGGLVGEELGEVALTLISGDPSEVTGQAPPDYRGRAFRRTRWRVTIAPLFVLEGAHTLVAGVGGPLARSAAVALAEGGATVSLMTRADDRAQEVEAQSILNECWSLGGRDGQVCRIDSTDPEAVEAALSRIEAQLGPVAVLATVPGPIHRRAAIAIRPEDWDAEVSTAAAAVIVPALAVGRRMVERGSGRIVNVVSTLLDGAEAETALFAASQGAVQAFTRTLATEWTAYAVLARVLVTTDVEAGAGPHAHAELRAALRDLVTGSVRGEVSA